MTMPTPPVLNRVHPVIWATLAMLAAAAVLMAPACSALESAAKETSAIGRAGKAVEQQADGAATDAQAAKDALAKARESGGVGPEAEPFRWGGRDGDRLDPIAGWRPDGAREGNTGAGVCDPSAFDGRAGQGAGVDGRGEVGGDCGGLPGTPWPGDLPGDWSVYETGHQGGWQPGEPGDGVGSETRRGGDGSGTDGPGGGVGAAPAVGDAGSGVRSLLRRIFQGGEAGGGDGDVTAAYPRYGPRIALAGLDSAGYLDLIVCVWLALAGKWVFIRFGTPIKDIVAALLARLIGWIAVKVGAPVVPSAPVFVDPATTTTKTTQ